MAPATGFFDIYLLKSILNTEMGERRSLGVKNFNYLP
jgi:hypothetical protein